MNLKPALKALKLHESTISTILGVIVIAVLGVIVINYFRNLSPGETLTTGATVKNSQGTQPVVSRGEGAVTYIVGEGESLWEIAEKQYSSGYNWVDIAQENNLTNAGYLEVGQELVIPDVEPKQTTVETSFVSAEEVTDQSISGATYTVQQGDNLWRIAVRAYGDGYMWSEIAAENGLDNPHLIHTGNILTLPR